jgi:hypothetical protein
MVVGDEIDDNRRENEDEDEEDDDISALTALGRRLGVANEYLNGKKYLQQTSATGLSLP